jgi:hypothetical protein
MGSVRSVRPVPPLDNLDGANLRQNLDPVKLKPRQTAVALETR